MERLLVLNEFLRRQDGAEDGQQDSASGDQQHNVSGPAPDQTLGSDALKSDGAGSEQNGVDGRDVVVLPFERNESRQRDQECPAENAVASAWAAEEKPEQSCNPKRRQQRVHDGGLVSKEGQRAAHYVAAAHADVMHELQERIAVAALPDKIGQGNDDAGQHAQPPTARLENAP